MSVVIKARKLGNLIYDMCYPYIFVSYCLFVERWQSIHQRGLQYLLTRLTPRFA
jgi:hypothetical protein